MKKEITVQDGLITEEVHTVPTLTISHSRKISDNNYGSSDYFVSMQLDVPLDATEEQKTDAINNGFTLVRTLINLQHAGETAAPTANEARIAADLGGEIVAEQPKAKVYKKPYQKAEPASDENKPSTKDGLWQELVDNPNRYFLNPASKKPNPKGPDARRKGTGDGLWLSDCPAGLLAQVKALIESAA